MKKLLLMLSALLLLAGCTGTAPTPPSQPLTGGATYEDYSEERYDELKGQKPFVLFFHAAWCSECRSIEKELKANLHTYSKEIIILKADFDSETELRKELNVKVQTSFVIFDSAGNVVVNKPIFHAEEVIEEITKTL
jgi:thioredoxin 1